MTKIFINGLGRIGRSVLRAWALGAAPDLTVVGVNDIAAPDLIAHLFEYDSIFGPFPGKVALHGATLMVNDHTIPVYQTADIRTVDLNGVDILAECTGKAGDRAVAERGLAAGAQRVLISGPSETADATVVLGANDADLGNQKIVSNASCTTNALAPLVRILHDTWGLKTGWMTTIHCYTGSQPTIDAPRGDMMRSRAAALSMVPTTTSAMRLLDHVLPDISGRIEGAAVRVPVASVSAVDLTVTLDKTVSLDQVATVLGSQHPIIGTTTKPLVSTDLRARSESLIVALPECRITSGGLLRIFGWYDNEMGFAHRMLDMAQRMGTS